MRHTAATLLCVGIGMSAFAACIAVPDRVLFIGAAMLVYVGGAGIVAFHARRVKLPRLGIANVVTLVRLAIACLLAAYAGLLIHGTAPDDALARGAVVLAVVALILDGFDGWIARRLGIVSRFGARFDMEVDAFFILVLATVAWTIGKAGVWVLAIGAARYAYVAAGIFWPILARPLFPSQRRKTIAVVQMSVLTVLLAPEIVPPVSSALAAGALLLLLYSFAADIRWQIGAPLTTALPVASE